jgi:outer membrane lipoprotein-sorting protein
LTQTDLSRRLILALGLAAALAGAAPALADPRPAGLAADDQSLVDKAADYFSSMTDVKGRFTQTGPRGDVSAGALYLERPGKARFVYDPPSSQLIVSDGTNISRYDPRLKTYDHYPLGSTPLALFLAKDVRASKGVEVTHVQRFADSFAVTARDARHPRAGQVTLTFSDNPVRLREWALTDAQGGITRVRIAELQSVGSLDPDLFVLRDPRKQRP